MSPVISTVLLLCLLIFEDEANSDKYMYNKSYDDNYDGCQTERETQVRDHYLNYEISENTKLALAWNESINHWRSGIPPGLDNYTTLAVTTYTNKRIFSEMNTMVENGVNFVTNKHYRSMHFLLTKAIQTLKGRNCIRVYRGIKEKIRPIVSDAFRFGRFASTSTDIKVAIRFGTETIFNITTCQGADISKYSFYNESEVLIPPYEEFIVTKVNGGNITLESVKVTVFWRCAPLSDSSTMSPDSGWISKMALHVSSIYNLSSQIFELVMKALNKFI